MTFPGPLDARFFVDALNQHPLVEKAELNSFGTIGAVTPIDQHWNMQWALRIIGMEEVWPRNRGGYNRIAILDTGIASDHPDLVSKIARDTSGQMYGHSVVLRESTGYVAEDLNGHGTQVAGILAAQTTFPGDSPAAAVGIAGVSPYTTVVPVKVVNRYGFNSTVYDLASAIDYAIGVPGVRFINASLQNYDFSQAVLEAIKRANDKNVAFVTIMGNYNPSLQNDSIYNTRYPGLYWRTMAVSATNVLDARTWYSKVGANNSVAAPGGDEQTGQVLSTSLNYDSYYGGRYKGDWGTSFAAPHVAGLADLVQGIFPGMTWSDLQYRIEDTAVDVNADYANNANIGWDGYIGWGRINANAATTVVTSTHGFPAAPRRLISLPAWPMLSSADSVAARQQDLNILFPNCNAQVTWYDPSAYDPTTGTNGRYIDYLDPSLSAPRFGAGRGYWVRLDAPCDVAYSAALPYQKPNHPLPVYLKPGYNGIGVPGHAPIVWNPQTAKIRTGDNYGVQQIRTVTEAAALGWVNEHIWRYDWTTGRYEYVNPGESLWPGHGYWFQTARDCQLLLPSP